jgi:nicotinate phosphoribosyltransferase
MDSASPRRHGGLGLLTDLYQLTMSAGYYEAGKLDEKATFELFIRRLPPQRNYVVAAGLEQAVEYLSEFRFTGEDVDYVRHLPQFKLVPAGFFDYLAELRFTGDLWAVREGTPVFPGEPILTLRAPIVEAQIPETYLLSTIGFQSMIATKAARIAQTAGARAVVEFGTRRAHSPEAGTLAGRASYIGGCLGTSNTLAGIRHGVPVYGTAAHSWVMAFPTEQQAFEALQKLLGPKTTYLIDTYDTLEGARRAARLGRPMWGVRLDSGNVVELAREVRRILDDAGLPEAKIMATGDLNEQKIRAICEAGAPIDLFGVGTELAVSLDAPTLGAIYKLVEMEIGGHKRYTAKFSDDKQTYPGPKQILRYRDRDLIAGAWECPKPGPDGDRGEALLRPVMLGGRLVEPLPTAADARAHCTAMLARLPDAVHSLEVSEEPYRVEYSRELLDLLSQVREATV